jgi:asparagine synthase (glutamine-hydrolysing)
MCGIAGVLHFDPERPVDRRLLGKMGAVLSHRGPDGDGYYVDGPIGLAHKRLAIIDLLTGAQPMASRDGDLVIVFNGEIYNYVELRAELQTLGCSFETSSDTEVILQAYRTWGFDCQPKLNGMWAFALWDRRQRTLVLSRDRIGEKPLFYSVKDRSILFGSEIKSILAAGFTYPMASHLLHVYLSLGYVPAPHTFYDGVSKLLPGHFLVVKDATVQDRVYWDVPEITEADMRTDHSKVLDEFEQTFENSVAIRMRSDVPFGAFLSGGLDSSSVVAAMSQLSRSPVETFTIGFAEKSFDERQLAGEVAARFHTNHHEAMAAPETFDESLDRILHHFDEPFGDASAIPVGLVSHLARQHVTMALTGDGGDEVLSGYTTYLAERVIERYRRVPGFLRAGLRLSTQLSLGLARNEVRYKLNRLQRFLDLANGSFDHRFTSKLARLDRGAIRNLLPTRVPQLSIEDYLSDVFKGCRFTDPFYRLMYFNLKVSLPDDMLTKVDRMSMAHSLETRVPFLDHRLIELTYGVSKQLKLPHRQLKSLLKQTYGKKLPASIVSAPKKPFSVPLREWFKQAQFEERLTELQRVDFGLNSRVIADIVGANNRSTEDYGDFIWRLFVLKKWTTDQSIRRAA